MSTVAQAADHLFVSERRFYEMIDQRIITRCDPGDYDLDRVRKQCFDHLRQVAAGRAGNSDAALSAERARLAKQQADAQEMKNSTSRGDLLPREEVHVAVTGSFARVRTKMLAIPSKVAPLILGLGSVAEIRDKLTDVTHEALAELAATKVVRVSQDRGGRGGRGRGAGLVGGPDAAARRRAAHTGRTVKTGDYDAGDDL